MNSNCDNIFIRFYSVHQAWMFYFSGKHNNKFSWSKSRDKGGATNEVKVGVVHVERSDSPTDSFHQYHTTVANPHAMAWAAVRGCCGHCACNSDEEEVEQVYRANLPCRLLLLGKTTNRLVN